MSVDISQAVEEPAALLDERRHHPRMPMSYRRHPEARGEIDIEVAVDVQDVGSESLLPEDRSL
jgi:hypothetical protein